MLESPSSYPLPTRRSRAVRLSILLSTSNTSRRSKRILLSSAKSSVSAVDITINTSATVSSLPSSSLSPSPYKRTYLS
jgi:hypothetical protein